MADALETPFHRLVGWHATARRRVAVAAGVGVVGAAALSPFVVWQVTVLGGWDAAALMFLLSVWVFAYGADASATERFARREDLGRETARVLLLASGLASLVAVGLALGLARSEQGAERALLVAISATTVIVSWTVLNTVYALRYADLHYGAASGGIDFGGVSPDFRDFAYVAFTIGMTYQVSDTNLRDRSLRRAVLGHALLSYLYGVVIVATGVNVVAGLL